MAGISDSEDFNAIFGKRMRVVSLVRGISTFTPTAMNLFHIVSVMDSVLTEDMSFPNLELPWHPLLTRLYIAELFYIQVLRAMHSIGLGSMKSKAYMDILLREVPPKTLPIPGPLVPIFKSICCTRSDLEMFDEICPLLPSIIGPDALKDLIREGNVYSVLPQIPLILGFIRTILDSDGQIPNYSDSCTFDNSQPRHLVGHVFVKGDWTELELKALLTPALAENIDTSNTIDKNFRELGGQLSLPVPEQSDNVSDIFDFMYLSQGTLWLKMVAKVMHTYCTFFKQSETLADCPPVGPTSCLLMSKAKDLTSATPADNVINTLTHAFPGKYPIKLIYEHTAYESKFPDVSIFMGQVGAINTCISCNGLGSWSSINETNRGRNGPYWTHNTITTKKTLNYAMLKIPSVIYSKWFQSNSNAD